MPTIPPTLRKLQEQFGQAISTPLELLDEQAHYRVHTERYDGELVSHLLPRTDMGLSGADRLATYNQQYWFRLLSTMQEEYPLLARLAGPRVFAQLVMDYLQQFPSHSPSLRDLSQLLVTFMSMSTDYNRPQWVQAAELGYLYIHAFDATANPVLDLSHLSLEEQEGHLFMPLMFQPHWRLFTEDWNLVELRMIAKSENDPEGDILIPAHGRHHWAIYRQLNGHVAAEPLGPIQFQLLNLLQQGHGLEAAVETIAQNSNHSTQLFMEERLAMWFNHWRMLGWFSQHVEEDD